MNVFDEALVIIRERGMCKWTREDRAGRVCLYGALSIARFGEAHLQGSEPLMDRVARELFPDRSTSPSAAYVNNHDATTQEDVELILKHCSYEYDLLHPEGE